MEREMRDYSQFDVSPEDEAKENDARHAKQMSAADKESELFRIRKNIQTGPRRSGSHKKIR